MAFKLTSQAPCAHRSNESDFEMGGAVVKGCGGKLKQRQGDTWINGLICDGNCNYGVTGNRTAPNLGEREHTEPDWISKEIAFQELFCNDRPTPWELFKDQHNINVVSALTAVATVFRDWCVVEKDLTELIVNEKIGNFSCLSGDYLSDSNMDLSKEVELLASLLAQDDFPLDKSLKEHCKNFVMPYHSLQQSGLLGNADASEPAQVFGTKAFEDDLHACQRTDSSTSSSEKQSEICGHLLQCSWRSAEWKKKSGPNDARKQIAAPTDSDRNNGSDPFVGLNMHALFGKQISSSSRFSFGREDGVVTSLETDSITPLRALEEPEVTNCKASRNCRVGDSNKGTGFDGAYEGGGGEQMGEDLVPEGLLYTLSYMSLQDLLTMEKVCRSLRNRIKNDVLLWQRLHIELPMSNSLTDDVFLELASRSRGQLQSLSLVDCTRVTEAALEHVVLSNPRLSKLSLPGCSRISADGVVRMVEMLTQHSFSGLSSLKQLRVRNMDGFTKEHLERLQKMVGVRTQDQSSKRKPQYYHLKHHVSFHDDDRVIDVEECPNCTNVRLVYDCTREKCQQRKGLNFQDCRACILCIVRCEACGRCITDNDYEETFSLDVLCSRCWLGLPKCAECNRPACGSHADHFIRTPETTFVCGECCGTFPETNGSEFRVCA